MALESTASRISYSGNGVTTAFSFPYYFLANADLVVISRVTATGVETTKTITTDYTITGAGESSGGTVTMLVAPAAGTSLIIYRDPAATQAVDLVENDPLPAEVVEGALDKAAMISQRLKNRLDRAVTLSEGYTAAFTATLPALLEEGALMINAAGTGFEIGPTSTEIADAEANAIAAAASAAAALVSENNAETAETNAETAETNAEAAAVAAAASEAAAAASAAAALTSENNAETAETNAELAETNAETAQAAALVSQNAAAASATAADVSADAALVSETNAAASAAAAALVVAGLLISADTNDASTGNIDALTTSGLGSVRLTGAAPTLRGINSGIDGKLLFLNNATGADVTVKNEDSAPSAEDRILTGTAADFTLKKDSYAIFKYDSTTQRWKLSGGAGGGGSASGMEVLQTQNALAGNGFSSPRLDNSIRVNALEIPAHTYSHSRLIENYTASGSTIKIVHNPVTILSTDADYDSITGWAVVGAGTTLAATAGSTKVGSNHFSFNKDGSAVDASIRHTLAAQTLSVGANYRVYFWIDMPSVTGLSSVFLKIMGAATTDFSRWNLTTNSAGGAIATGYNLFFVDVANTAASTTGGTAWTSSQLARYVEVGVTTGSAGQTYTGIKFGGLWFSHGDIAAFGNKYLEYTAYDTTNKSDFKMASSNSTLDGIVTLSSTVATSYTAGIAAAAAAKFVRSSLAWSQSGLIGFDTALSAGAVSLEQELRATKLLRESLSGSYSAYVDMFTPQIYKVTSVGGSTIGVADSENHSANLLSGDSVHIFTTTYSDGEPNFTLLATRAMSAGASHSSGTTTLTLTTTSIAVGDYVVKQHLTASASVVASTADESFSALSYDTTPNGAQLIAARAYPNPSSVYAHWWMGGPTEAIALKDQSGNNRNIVKVGSPNFQDTFKAGKFAMGTVNSSNFIRYVGNGGLETDGTGELIQVSGWFYYDGSYGASSRYIANGYASSGGNRGWFLTNDASSNNLILYMSSTGSTTATSAATLTAGNWYHYVAQVESTVTQQFYLNGVKYSAGSPHNMSPIATTSALYFGVFQNSGTTDNTMIPTSNVGLKWADTIVWRNGPLLTQSDVNYLYNAGVPQFYGHNPALLRNEYALAGATGNRISLKCKLNRSTSAVSPAIINAGIIKTG